MIEAVESFYRAVKARIIVLNSSRVVAGFMDALEWPPQQVQMESFYLITLGDAPGGRMQYSPSAMPMIHTVQWAWIIQGDNLAAGVRGRNAGNRFRKHWAMKTELMNGLFPYFTEKLSWSAQQVGGAITTQGTSLNPKESIIWTPPVIKTQVDKKSGLVYGSAQVQIWSMTDAITS